MKKNSTDSRKARAMLTVSRVLVYALLIFLSVLCLFSFYMLIVNASRTNADLQGGFKALPQGHFLENLKNAWNDSSINIPRGMLNSFIVAAATAILSTYFSALTAYGLHAYHFKLKRLAFLFILLAILPVLLVYIFLSRYIVSDDKNIPPVGVDIFMVRPTRFERATYRVGVFRHQRIKCCVFKECSAFGENVRLF